MDLMQRGDRLVERLSAGGDDKLENELLNAVFAGYPMDRLRRLLQSPNDSTVESGVWIANELAPNAGPLMDDIARLLSHPDRSVRYYATQTVLTGGTTDHGTATAKAVALITDPDENVRYAVLQLLGYASREQLAASLPSLPGGRTRDLTSWLIKLGTGTDDVATVIARLDGADDLERLFAAAGAARLAPSDITVLEHAAESDDEEVRDFAVRQLPLFRRRHRSN